MNATKAAVIFCLPNENYTVLNGSPTEQRLFQYIFPLLAILGIVGNCITMFVLKDGRTSRALLLFIIIAIADVFFFITMIPSWLVSYPSIAQNMAFREVFFAVKVNMTALANFLSSFSNWTIALLSYEMYKAVRNSTRMMSAVSLKGALAFILAISFLSTVYLHFDTRCETTLICSGTQLIQTCRDLAANTTQFGTPSPTPEWIRAVVRVMRYAHALIGITLPLAIIIVFNASLIHHTRFRKNDKLSDGLMNNSSQQSISHSYTINQQRIEQNLRRIASLIITIFLLTNIPSTLLLIYQAHFPANHNSMSYYAQFALSFLTFAGKSSNFVIFFLLSHNFRQSIKAKIACESKIAAVYNNVECIDVFTL